MNYYEEVRDLIERELDATTSDAQGVIEVYEMTNSKALVQAAEAGVSPAELVGRIIGREVEEYPLWIVLNEDGPWYDGEGRPCTHETEAEARKEAEGDDASVDAELAAGNIEDHGGPSEVFRCKRNADGSVTLKGGETIELREQ